MHQHEGIALSCLPPPETPATRIIGSKAADVEEDLDLELLRRVRDDVFRATEHGSRYADIYYKTTPEIAKILILDLPGLGMQAVRVVEALQPALRNLIDGDGNELITAAQIDSLSAFLSVLREVGSDSLTQLIDDELARTGPLENYAGAPVREVVTAILGESIETPIENEGQPSPAGFALEQNFPNPFRASTEIRYALSAPALVELTVFNIEGQRIRVLVNETRMSGVHSVVWHGADESGHAVSSGLYLLRLKTSTFQTTKVMVLNK